MSASIRPMEVHESSQVISYFLGMDESSLRGMGVEPSKLPTANQWHQLLEDDFGKRYDQRQFFYVIWELAGEPIGHSNINKIAYGDCAFVHLHIWDDQLRRSNYGTDFLRESIQLYFELFRLEKLYCEPNAQNEAPNRTLPKIGFEHVETYETTPGWINFRQFVKRWQLSRAVVIPRQKTRIETERLILREFELGDAQDVYEFATDPQVTRYTGDGALVKSLDDAMRVIVDVWHSDYRKYGYGRLAVVDRASDKVIGFCGLKYLDDLGQVDIGYRLLPAYWGRGLATEAALASLRHGQEEMGLQDIIGLVVPENMASHRVLQKLGLQPAGQMSLAEAETVCVYRTVTRGPDMRENAIST